VCARGTLCRRQTEQTPDSRAIAGACRNSNFVILQITRSGPSVLTDNKWHHSRAKSPVPSVRVSNFVISQNTRSGTVPERVAPASSPGHRRRWASSIAATERPRAAGRAPGRFQALGLPRRGAATGADLRAGRLPQPAFRTGPGSCKTPSVLPKVACGPAAAAAATCCSCALGSMAVFRGDREPGPSPARARGSIRPVERTSASWLR